MEGDNEELYRRLEQARRLVSAMPDTLTRERLKTLTQELEQQIEIAEAMAADAPPE